MDCVFCRIVNGEIPSKKVYEDEHVYAFYDIEPKAPVHVLVIPKEHVMASALDCDPQNSLIYARLFEAVAKIAGQLNLKDGFRVVTNSGDHAGQTVPHLHFHILGGGPLSEMA